MKLQMYRIARKMKLWLLLTSSSASSSASPCSSSSTSFSTSSGNWTNIGTCTSTCTFTNTCASGLHVSVQQQVPALSCTSISTNMITCTCTEIATFTCTCTSTWVFRPLFSSRAKRRGRAKQSKLVLCRVSKIYSLQRYKQPTRVGPLFSPQYYTSLMVLTHNMHSLRKI